MILLIIIWSRYGKPNIIIIILCMRCVGEMGYNLFSRVPNGIPMRWYIINNMILFYMNLLFDAPVQLSKRATVNGDGFYRTFNVHVTRVIMYIILYYYCIVLSSKYALKCAHVVYNCNYNILRLPLPVTRGATLLQQ